VYCTTVTAHPNIAFGEGRYILTHAALFTFPTQLGGGFSYFGPNFIVSAAGP
jgi:hypothetical protein